MVTSTLSSGDVMAKSTPSDDVLKAQIDDINREEEDTVTDSHHTMKATTSSYQTTWEYFSTSELSLSKVRKVEN